MRGSLDARHPVPGARSPEPYDSSRMRSAPATTIECRVLESEPTSRRRSGLTSADGSWDCVDRPVHDVALIVGDKERDVVGRRRV